MADLKLYLPSTGAAAVTVAASPLWTVTDMVARAAVTTKINSAMTSHSSAVASEPSGSKVGANQWVSDVQAARSWTTSDKFSTSIECFEWSGSGHAFLYVILRIVSQDGGTVRGTLYAGQPDATALDSALISRYATDIAVQNAVSQQANDRIVVEYGWIQDATAYYGCDFRMGDLTAGADLALSNADTSDANPWISFIYGGGAVAPTVTTTTPTNIGSSTATSGGNVTSDGGAAVTHKGVCWSTSANPTTADSKTDDGTGTGSYASAITGLSPQTGYHVRAYATNSVGTSYGADDQITTGLDVTEPLVGVSG